MECRLLRASRLKVSMLAVVLLFLAGVPAQAYFWTLLHGLPPSYIWTLQQFRLMQAGLLEEPLPELTSIEAPLEKVIIGEGDQEFINVVSMQPVFRMNFGVPSASVQIKAAFAIGIHELTYQQYDYYVWTSRVSNSSIKFPDSPPLESERGQRAVVSVSWNDANAYLHWLSEKTGDVYRLPTEAEWEYASRAGSDTTFWWGDSIESESVRANCDGCGSEWDNQRVAPVGSFAPNPWGLFDTAGNVWEWTCSAWQEKFDGNESRCVEPDDTSGSRALRGGSWINNSDWMRSSSRNWINADFRSENVGFRALRVTRAR